MEEKINIKRLLIKMLCVAAGGVMIGFFLMVLVYMLPTEPMRENVKRSANEWYDEGAWPVLINGYSSSVLDNFTDSLMLSVAVFENEESTVTRAMKNYYAMRSVDMLSFDSLYAYLQGESCYGENYARYWHGYLVILKPLLLVFSYSDLRILNMFVLCMLLAYVSGLCCKKLSKGAGAVFLLMFVFLMPLTLFQCLDMANMMYVTLLAMIALFKKQGYWEKREHAVIYFLAVGMVTSYMDFLTYPIITLGVPVVTYMALKVCRKNRILKLWDTAVWIVSWGLGYGGMWSAKWILASLFTGENIILNALRTVKKRSDMYSEDSGLMKRFGAITDNFHVLFQGVFGKLLVICIISMLCCLIRNCKRYGRDKKGIWLIGLVAMIPLVWLFVTSEHASIHSWFTYRNLVVCIYSLGMMSVCFQRKLVTD